MIVASVLTVEDGSVPIAVGKSRKDVRKFCEAGTWIDHNVVYEIDTEDNYIYYFEKVVEV